jgi:hypothetical protein
VVFTVQGIAFVVAVAVLIGSVLTALPFVWGMGSRSPYSRSAVELRRFWPRCHDRSVHVAVRPRQRPAPAPQAALCHGPVGRTPCRLTPGPK